MNIEEIQTPEQLEELRQQKLRERTAPLTIAGPETKSTAESFDSRLKRFLTFNQIAEGSTREDISKFREIQRDQIEKAERASEIRDLRNSWNAPKRATLQTNLDTSGPWGDSLNKLKSRLGSGFMIALIGGRGPGKTQMGYELMKAATEALLSAYYATCTEFFMAIKGTYKRDCDDTEADIMGKYRKVKFLVLDEVSKRGETDWEDRLLFELLDKRYRDMTDTLLISNEDKVGFENSIGPSVAARMRETGGIIHCNWPSFRK